MAELPPTMNLSPYNPTHGETAYAWGNHASAGYLTAQDDSAIVKSRVALTGQVADIAATAFAGTSTAGLYRVSGYIKLDAADPTAGFVDVIVKHNDGAARSQTVGGITLTTMTGAYGALFAVVYSATGSVTYEVDVTGIYGTSSYSLFLTCEKL